MHDHSDEAQLRDEILDHPANEGLDAHERSALYQRISGMSFTELEAERGRIGARAYE